ALGRVNIAHIGTMIKESLRSLAVSGENGVIYGTPKERSLHKCKRVTTTVREIPRKPKKLAIINKMKRMYMIVLLRGGVIKLHMAVMATMITIRLLAIPAATDASPNTIAPTMLSACPIVLGIRTPASRKSSKAIIINIASTKGENGTPCREAASVII